MNGHFQREYREREKLTQAELANEVSVSENYIYMIEAGVRTPSVDTAKKIATRLGFDWTQYYQEGESA